MTLVSTLAACSIVALIGGSVLAQTQYVQETGGPGSFPIAQGRDAAAIYVDSNDHAGVIRAAGDLRADIGRVTDRSPGILHDETELAKHAIVIGTIGKSQVIDRLIRDKKIDVNAIAGKWESFLLEVVPQPLPGVESALVIAGSDKRGTVYGIYDLSEQIGVSPWYWWADVPVRHKVAIYVNAGRFVQGPPVVKYRGIFLNDEAPCLSGWARERFGGFNHDFYAKVFELLLRLKGNYLWPAMWGNAFNEDDPANPKLADEYGIVMGTSHHEPMLRAQQEWKRHGKGPWNYATNADGLREFWEQGVAPNKNYESIITIGMRGDGDMPMVRGGDMAANVALLEKIVADQRQIISQQINPNVSAVPQLWALYKEVQGYYENGMRVPDDVTLLWCDDNWGNIRRLPTEAERKRSGGAGIYYHFDYVGGPRNYKWINTNPIPKVWEQMNLALNYGADRIWIVNVGDLKPMEFPMEFFLRFAWNPQAYPKEHLREYTRLWAERQFGTAHAQEIADIISKYTKYNGQRKPELLEPDTYSLVDYHEADNVQADFLAIAAKAQEIYDSLPADARDAFFQLVLHPAKASAIVNELYITVGKNRLYAGQGRASTNALAARARALFKADQELSDEYNHTLAQGKWNHMMDQTHIGYTNWQQPPENVMPSVTEIEIPAEAKMGVAVEGSASAWPGSPTAAALAEEFDSLNRQRRYIDVFNSGQTPFDFTARASDPWIVLSQSHGTVEKDQRVWISIDWSKAPAGSSSGSVKIAGAGDSLVVAVNVANPSQPTRESLEGFFPDAECATIEAEHCTNKIDTPAARWEKIDDYGRNLSAISIFPVTAPSANPPENSPCLQYKIFLPRAGKVDVHAMIAPTQAFVPGRGLRLALSFDDQPPQVVDALAHNSTRDWEQTVRNNIRIVQTTHTLPGDGYHVLKIWMVDPGIVLERIVVDLGGMKPSYLGPPESFHRIGSSP